MLVVDGFEAEFGGGEVELVDVARWRFGVNHDVDALSLVDVFLSLRSLLDDGELADFGKGFVDFFFFVVKGGEVLYGAVVEQNAFPGFFVVEVFFLQQFYQERVFVGGFDFGEVFDVVVGFEGFNRGRDAAEDEAAGFGRGDAHQGGVAAAIAGEDFRFAEFGGEFFRGGKGFFLQQAEDFVVFLHGGEAVEGDALRLQVAVPAEDTEAEGTVAFGEAVRAVKEGDVRAFGDEFAHYGVEEAGEGFDGVGVFPFFVVQQVHGGKTADEAFFIAGGQHDFGAEIGGVDGQV